MRSQLAKRVLASLLSAVLAFSTFLTPEALAADALSDNGNVVLRDGSFTAEIDAKLPIVKLYSVSGNTLPANESNKSICPDASSKLPICINSFDW